MHCMYSDRSKTTSPNPRITRADMAMNRSIPILIIAAATIGLHAWSWRVKASAHGAKRIGNNDEGESLVN